MTNDIFGRVIDYDTLRGMPEYQGKTITQADLAKVALDLQVSGEYDADCIAHVENMKKKLGYGTSTAFWAYNATGDDLNFILLHDFNGHIYENPYPLVIKNGQWVSWVDLPPAGLCRRLSTAVVYRGINSDAVKMDWLLTWAIYNGPNKVYTEIREEGHYETECFNWDCIEEKLNNGGPISEDENNGCKSYTIISETPVVVYKAIMSLTC
jgi:hypothetical protein